MVRHIVFWKIKDDENKQKNIDRMIEMLTSLVGKIDGLVGIEMGYNFDVSSDYDVVLNATFKNAVALKYYQNHPEHIKCKEFIGKISIGRVAADYFWESECTVERPFNEVPDAPNTASEDTAPVIEPVSAPVITAEKPITESVVQPAPVAVEAPAVEPIAQPAPVAVEAPVVEPIAQPAPTPVEKPVEKTSFFSKKKDNIEVTPLEQRTDTWTCPNCGKVMPNYVGTCGCGEAKPFEDFAFAPETTAPVTEPVKTPAVAPVSAPAPVAKPVEKPAEKTSFFSKKKDNIEVTPLEQRTDTWTCPNCGKVMPNYVGTCGCGEAKPFEDFAFAPETTAPVTEPVRTPAVAPVSAPAPVAKPVEKPAEKTSFFSKKKDNIEVTPLEQRTDTWTCPNCGKVMPNYVGTCGCGEAKPFEDFAFAPETTAPVTEPVRTPAVAPVSAPAPVAKPVEKPAEKTSFFSKKKDNIEVTPLEQRTDTWTCPNCGKVMPNYVGTCGCGEAKPFEDFAFAPETTAPVTEPVKTPAVAPVSASAPVVKSEEKPVGKPSFFPKKKNDIEVTPLEQRTDTWTCPNCGKVMPNYVGTCGCGEAKPFEDFPPAVNETPTINMPPVNNSDDRSPLPDIEVPNNNQEQINNIYETKQQFSNVEPSLPSYNPQITNNQPNVPVQPNPELNYIKNDSVPAQNNTEYNSSDFSFIKPSTQDIYNPNTSQQENVFPNTFNNNYSNPNENTENELEPIQFDDAPPPAPMRFNDAPPAPMHFEENHAEAQNSSKPEKKRPVFGKKAKEEALFQQAVATVNQRKDVPTDKWQCPNCGKVMPNYVGTCGCGEPKPFEDDF